MYNTLSGEVLQKLIIDSVFFYFGLLIALLIVCKRYQGQLRYCLIMYVIVTFSAFNIFIKPVQDYLIPIPRTFIFYYKVFDRLSLYDIFLLIVIAIITVKYISKKHNNNSKYIHKGILYAHFYRDIILFFLSLLGGLVYLYVGGEVDWTVHIRIVRVFLSAIVIMHFIPYFIRKIDSCEKAQKLISTLSFLTLINMLSEFVSSFFLQGISWERGGHSVVFFDQTSANLIMIYLPCILVPYKSLDKMTRFTSIIVTSLIFYNYIKTSYLWSGLVLLSMGILGLKYNKLPKRVLYIYPLFIIAMILYINFFISSSGNDKMTRVGQFESYIETIQKKNSILYITGVGDGGLFKRQNITEDGGEIRAMDLDKNETVQFAFQLPFLIFFKRAGIIGIICVLYIFIYSFHKSSKWIFVSWYVTTCALFMTIVSFAGGGIMGGGDPQGAFIWGAAYLYMHMGLIIIRKEKYELFL
jgi:hypothetical protein